MAEIKGTSQKSYKVLRIDELVTLSDLGKPEKLYRHTIKTSSGVVVSVDISSANFTPEKAVPILEAKAIEVNKIMSS